MPRSSTSFKPGNKAASGRGKPLAVLIANAFDEAALNICNDARREARRRMFRIDPKLADELFSPTTDKMVAMAHMIEHLANMAKFDKTALKIFWDRYIPKPKMPMVEIPGLDDMTPEQAANTVTAMVAAGELAPDVAQALVTVFLQTASIREAEANTRLMNAMAEEEEAQQQPKKGK